MYNKVILIGRLTKDPDARVTNSGLPVASFTLAVNRNYGEREADFINCVCFRKLAEIVGRYVRKGSLISVDGRLQTRSYDAQDGTKRYVTEVICDNVVFLDTKQQGQGSNNYQQQQQQQQYFNPNQSNQQSNNNSMFGYNNSNNNNAKKDDNYFEDNPEVDISEDDLPF
jgi:single-strand DNA-binding protein